MTVFTASDTRTRVPDAAARRHCREVTCGPLRECVRTEHKAGRQRDGYTIPELRFIVGQSNRCDLGVALEREIYLAVSGSSRWYRRYLTLPRALKSLFQSLAGSGDWQRGSIAEGSSRGAGPWSLKGLLSQTNRSSFITFSFKLRTVNNTFFELSWRGKVSFTLVASLEFKHLTNVNEA